MYIGRCCIKITCVFITRVHPSPSCTGLLKDLVASHDNEQLVELADSALQLLPGLPSLDRDVREQRALADQLHSSAIALWNRCGRQCACV